MRGHLVIFVKEPVAGRVKTRLGRQISMPLAAWWFRHQARALIRRLGRDPRWQCWLAVSPDGEGLTSRFWPADLPRWPQGRGDLGERMGRAFEQMPPGPVVIIGADIPGIRPAHIARAFAALGGADAVIGPTLDGGYWLIGLKRSPRRVPPGLFEGVRWSSAFARADTEATLSGLRIARVQTLRDVDDLDDLRALSRHPHAVSKG
ncbi:MAG: glycosyltransferase [Neomegalonema sp.]|nr:glycosyltransferase [Neomegalonema sp.]